MSLSAGSGDDGGGPRCEYDVAGEKCGSRTVPEVPEAPERRRSLHAEVPGARLVVGGGTERAWPLRGNWWGRDGAERVLCSVMWGRNCSEGVSCSEGRLARNCCGDSRPPTPSEGKPGRLFRGLMRPPRLAAAAAAAAGGSGKSGCGCGVGKPLPPMRSPAGMCECRCPPTRGTLKEPPMNPSPPYC